jgi:hypothetical protein
LPTGGDEGEVKSGGVDDGDCIILFGFPFSRIVLGIHLGIRIYHHLAARDVKIVMHIDESGMHMETETGEFDVVYTGYNCAQ